jgi:hypothetical protein
LRRNQSAKPGKQRADASGELFSHTLLTLDQPQKRADLVEGVILKPVTDFK